MLYEIRTYTPAANRAQQLKERFRDHTLAFFNRHGIEVVGCWEPVERPEELVYMVCFESESAREVAWSSFASDPDWRRVKQESEVDGPLLESQSAVVLTATDFSPVLR